MAYASIVLVSKPLELSVSVLAAVAEPIRWQLIAQLSEEKR